MGYSEGRFAGHRVRNGPLSSVAGPDWVLPRLGQGRVPVSLFGVCGYGGPFREGARPRRGSGDGPATVPGGQSEVQQAFEVHGTGP